MTRRSPLPWLMAVLALGWPQIAAATDSDGDGLPDAWEMAHFGHLDYGPADDPDGDGYLNIYEYIQDTDPADAADYPGPTRRVDPADTNAYPTIQAALNAVTGLYEIVAVADGVYTGSANRDLDFAGAKAMLVATGGLERCTIDGEYAGRGFYFDSGESNLTVVSGFTITRGGTNVTSVSQRGGGIYCNYASPTFLRVRVRQSQAYHGGGVSIWNASPRLWNVLIVSNETYYGRGNSGGGVFLAYANAEFRNCTIAHNRCGGSASSIGGVSGGGGNPLFENTIVWSNWPGQINVGTTTVRYSCVQGGYTGIGNITNNPQFADSLYRLAITSPCIDAGTNNLVITDWEGNPRYDIPEVTNAASAWDIGASELVDYDQDGLPDWWEMEFLGSLDWDDLDDPDGDGFPNVYEYLYGTLPNDPQSQPSIAHFVSGSGSHTEPYASWATAATNIQSALNVATNPYAIIAVGSGTYAGGMNRNLEFPAHPVLLMSAHGRDETVIDAQAAGRLAVLDNGQTLHTVLAGFTITNAVATGENYGGAIYCDGASLTILDCRFDSCSSYAGGALCAINNAPVRIERSVFRYCHSDVSGGALTIEDAGVIRASVFIENHGGFGGAIETYDTDTRIENCTFVGNTKGFGGTGGGIYGWGDPAIINCIFWNNQSGALYFSGSSTPQVSYSLVQGGWSGVGNITNDPQFADSRYRLAITSPCIDAGTNTLAMTDWEGNPRYDVPEVTNVISAWDIGASELVDYDQDGLPDWWEMAHFGHFDYGLEDDADGDGVLEIYEYLYGTSPVDSVSRPAGTHFVDPAGSHTPPFDTWAKAATNIQAALDAATNAYDFIWVADGVYSNWNMSFPEMPVTLMSTGGLETCIVDPGGMGRGFVFDAGQTAASVLFGFSVRNGNANGFGGGFGGGIYCTDASSPTIKSCLFKNNQAGYGGAISVDLASAARIMNCIFTGNNAGEWGGAIEIYECQPTIMNCTIVSNTAYSIGGGILCGASNGSWQPQIENVLFWGNIPDSIGTHNVNFIEPLVRHSLVPGGWAGGEQIIDADPHFIGSRLWLLGESPCIDAGSTAGPARDWEGEARWDHPAHSNIVSIRDIGADEFVDTDGDGLPDGFEREWGTDPQLADTDGDGDSDYAEFLAGTDPLDPDSRSIAISGVVTHTGAYGGPIRVLVSVDSNVWESAWTTTIASTGAYTVAKVPNTTNYYIQAYRDALANGVRDDWEPSGSYPGNPLNLVLADDQTGIDIVLEDAPEPSELVLSVTFHEPEDAAEFVYPHARVVVYCSSLMATVTVNQAATQRDGYLRYVWTGLVPGTNTLTAEATWDGQNIVSNAIAVVFDDSAYDFDADDDGDGVPNHADLFPLDPSESEDADADGVGANQDYNDLDPTVRGRLRITYPLNGQVFR